MKIFCAYIVIINLVTFIVRGIDKRKSVLKRRRISEKTLLYLSACG
ncbi:DUF1294 domain-containing protein [bacterium]|nr:DUF1294 domain-containing protein [bacterium]